MLAGVVADGAPVEVGMGDGEALVRDWTRTEVRALRLARRMSVREFADHLGVSPRVVSKWETAEAPAHPRPVNQAALDISLRQADPAVRARFALHVAAHRGRDTERGE